MKIKIISLKGIKYEGDGLGVVANTTGGQITVLDNHLPIITPLKAGVIEVIKDKEGKDRQKFETGGGFLEMNKENELTILKD